MASSNIGVGLIKNRPSKEKSRVANENAYRNIFILLVDKEEKK